MPAIPADIHTELLALAEEPYARFVAALTPGAKNILGVRLPHLRKIAKRMARGNWQEYLETDSKTSFEEYMLHGMLIGAIPADIETVLRHTEAFIPHIGNWSVCDSFCASLTCTRRHKKRVWEFLTHRLHTDKEYELRFCIVMMLDYYLDDEYISRVLDILGGIRHEAHYVRMAIAWALSMSFVRYPCHTLPLLQNGILDKETHNKTIRKIVESLQVTDNDKDIVRSLRRK